MVPNGPRALALSCTHQDKTTSGASQVRHGSRYTGGKRPGELAATDIETWLHLNHNPNAWTLFALDAPISPIAAGTTLSDVIANNRCAVDLRCDIQSAMCRSESIRHAPAPIDQTITSPLVT